MKSNFISYAIILFLCLSCMTISAQCPFKESENKEGNHEQSFYAMSAVEKAEIKSKQLKESLHLDEKQYSKVLKLYKSIFRNEEADKESLDMPSAVGFGNSAPGASGIERPSGFGQGGRPEGGRPFGGQGKDGFGPGKGKPNVEDLVKQAEERFEKCKKKMAKILSEEQYQQWIKIEQEELSRLIKREGNKKFNHRNDNDKVERR